MKRGGKRWSRGGAVARALAHVREVSAQAACGECGAQPIDWHHIEPEPDHSRKVSMMARLGCSIEEIDAEIAKCKPLCRKHHMQADGRSAAFTAAGRAARSARAPKVCSLGSCHRKYYAKGLCRHHYDQQRRNHLLLSSPC